MINAHLLPEILAKAQEIAQQPYEEIAQRENLHLYKGDRRTLLGVAALSLLALDAHDKAMPDLTNVRRCPECAKTFNLGQLDVATSELKPKRGIHCPHCGARLDRAEGAQETPR